MNTFEFMCGFWIGLILTGGVVSIIAYTLIK